MTKQVELSRLVRSSVTCTHFSIACRFKVRLSNGMWFNLFWCLRGMWFNMFWCLYVLMQHIKTAVWCEHPTEKYRTGSHQNLLVEPPASKMKWFCVSGFTVTSKNTFTWIYPLLLISLGGGYGFCSGIPWAGRSASGLHVRREGVWRGQDGPGHWAEVAHCGEATGVRVPVHRGWGEPASAMTLNSLRSSEFKLTNIFHFSGAVCDKGVRLHRHRHHRPANTFGLPERAGSRRGAATHRADHGQGAGLEPGAEDGTSPAQIARSDLVLSSNLSERTSSNIWWIYQFKCEELMTHKSVVMFCFLVQSADCSLTYLSRSEGLNASWNPATLCLSHIYIQHTSGAFTALSGRVWTAPSFLTVNAPGGWNN